MKRTCLLFLILFMTMDTVLMSQVFTDVEVGKNNTSLVDSTKSTSYPYSLPIWGAKADALGYNLPYSAGMSVNYLTQESALIIDNLQVGFNYGPMYNIDEIIRFNDATARASALTLRPDIWLLPFLNVYAIVGRGSSSTDINAGVYLPDTSGVWGKITDFSTKANFDVTMTGFGMTPTMGVAGGFLALDMNFVWTDVSALDKPVKTFVFAPRLGKSFKLNGKESTLAVWAGGFRVKFSSSTSGSLPIADLFPGADLQGKVDTAIANVGEKQMKVDEWWDNLSPVEQKNPVNIAKHETANRVLETAGHVLNSIDESLNDNTTATVQYSLDKRLKDAWNFIVGAQYQLNKHWMFRAEYGFLGSRTQFLASLQYRFGL